MGDTSISSGVNKSLHANYANLALPTATNVFRAKLEKAIRCNIMLKSSEEHYIKNNAPCEIFFTSSQACTHDHPVLAAQREIIRNIFSTYNFLQSKMKILVVGAGMREVKFYCSNPNIHYYLYCQESKDVSRIVVPMLEGILKQLHKKAAKSDLRLHAPKDATYFVPPVHTRYQKMKDLLDAYIVTNQLPNILHLDPVEANVLLFEDSIYEFSGDMLLSLFKNTNAVKAYGYGLFPFELLFPDIPQNKYYRFTKLLEPDGHTYGLLTYRHGFSNGYRHKFGHWSTVMTQTIIQGAAYDFALEVEFQSRIGAMAIFTLTKIAKSAVVIRTIELPPFEKYLLVLDLWASVNHHSTKLIRKSYISVREHEMQDIIDYCFSIDTKALNFKTIMNYIRRRQGGIMMETQTLVPAWQLQAGETRSIGLTVFLYITIMTDKYEELLANLHPTSVAEKFKYLAKRFFRYAFANICALIDLILTEHLTDELIMEPSHACFKYQRCEYVPNEMPCTLSGDAHDINVLIEPTGECTDDEEKCWFCSILKRKLPDGTPACGAQVIECHQDLGVEEWEIVVTDKDLAIWVASLADDDMDPEGLREVKKRAKECAPTAGFTIKLKVSYFTGGPGVGKSHVIKQLYDAFPENAAILAPFSKLLADYDDKDQYGARKYRFATNHRGTTLKNVKYMFVDEFTSMAMQFIAVAAYNAGVEHLLMFGDTKQTRVKEPEEGHYPGTLKTANGSTGIDFDNVPTHTLLVNFRNKPDRVLMMNKVYGYNMIPTHVVNGKRVPMTIEEIKIYGQKMKDGEIKPSIEFVKKGTQQAGKLIEMPALQMSFSKHVAGENFGNKNATVRSNQGQTTKYALLTAFGEEASVLGMESMQIVGLTRDTDKLYVIYDESEYSKQFLAKLDYSEPFFLEMHTFIGHVPLSVKPIELYDPVIDYVLPGINFEHPPNDSYLLLPTFLNESGMNPNLHSRNDLLGQTVGDKWTSGKASLAEAFVKLNARGHPQSKIKKWFAFGNGCGNWSESKRTMQVFHVLGDRYDSVKDSKMPFSLSNEEMKFATDSVDYYFEQSKDIDKIKNHILSQDIMNELLSDFVDDAYIRNYLTRYKGERLAQNVLSDLMFHVKEAFKPDNNMKGVGDARKPGQGVFGGQAGVMSMCGFIWRLIAYIDMVTNCNGGSGKTFNVVLNKHRKSELEFVKQSNLAIAQVVQLTGKPVIVNTDCTSMDTTRNGVTIFQEFYYNCSLGIDPQWLKWWYTNFRIDNTVHGDALRINIKTITISGRSDTLHGTGIVAKVNTVYMVDKIYGPRLEENTGDDVNIIGVGLALNQEGLEAVKKYTNLKMRITIGEVGEFAGYTVTTSGLYPNVYRKILKLAAHRWRDYKHFCEYQKSLRDYIDTMQWLGWDKVIANTMLSVNCSQKEAESMIYCIISWSHINEEQWNSVVSYHENDDSIPAKNPITDTFDFITGHSKIVPPVSSRQIIELNPGVDPSLVFKMIVGGVKSLITSFIDIHKKNVFTITMKLPFLRRLYYKRAYKRKLTVAELNTLNEMLNTDMQFTDSEFKLIEDIFAYEDVQEQPILINVFDETDSSNEDATDIDLCEGFAMNESTNQLINNDDLILKKFALDGTLITNLYFYLNMKQFSLTSKLLYFDFKTFYGTKTDHCKYNTKCAQIMLALPDEIFRVKYIPKTDVTLPSLHWGQLKLFISEVQFLTHVWANMPDQNVLDVPLPVVLYIGAGPGNHLPALIGLFPQFVYHFYDPTPFVNKVESQNCKYFERLFTEEDVLIYQSLVESGVDVFLISDVRGSEYRSLKADEVSIPEANACIETDMLLQQSWVEKIKPKYASLKFKLPYPSKSLKSSTFEYLSGVNYLQAYANRTTTETRLFVTRPIDKVFTKTLYDIQKYDDSMFYYNHVPRVSTYSQLMTHPGVCCCGDCTLMCGTLYYYVAVLQRKMVMPLYIPPAALNEVLEYFENVVNMKLVDKTVSVDPNVVVVLDKF